MEIQLWREILSPYELAVDELVLKFQYMIREYQKISGLKEMQRRELCLNLSQSRFWIKMIILWKMPITGFL